MKGLIKYSKILYYSKNLGSYFGASLIPMLLSLAINPWIAKNMSPEDYAISGYYTSFSSLIGPVIVFYLIHYFIKEYFRLDEDGRDKLVATIAKALIWFSGIISIVCFIGFLVYFKFIQNDLSFPVMPYLALMIFSLPLTGLLNLKLAQYRMAKKAKAYFYLSVSNGLIAVLCNILFVISLKWGAFGKLLAPLVCNSLVFIYMVIQYRDIIATKSSWQEYRTVFVFCLPLTISAMLGYFTHGFSTTYLESIGKTNEYGVYIVGAQIGGYLSVFQTAISSTFQPDIYENIIKRQWSRYIKFCLLQIGLITLIAGAFIVVAPLIIDILTAGRYTDSTPFAQIVCLSTITSAIYYLINNFCIATNRQNMYLITTIIGSIGVLILMPFLVQHWSFYGGAWMTVLSYTLFAMINLVLLLGHILLGKKNAI